MKLSNILTVYVVLMDALAIALLLTADCLVSTPAKMIKRRHFYGFCY